MCKDIKAKVYDEKLNEVGLYSLKKRRLRGDLIEVFKVLHGFSKWQHNLDVAVQVHNTRGHMFKLEKSRCRLDIRKHFFTQRVINHWNSLPNQVVCSLTVDTFKHRLDKYFVQQGVE